MASRRKTSIQPDSIWLRPPTGRRGPRPSLSREEITRVAIEVADAEGINAVSMRRIGAKLGAGAASLYAYITSKDDLHELMIDEVIGEIRLPRPSGDWRTDLRTIAERTYAVLRRHPWFVLLGIQPELGPKTRAYGEAALATLEGLGLDLATRINILAALNNSVFGFLYRETAWDQLRNRRGVTATAWKRRLRRQLEQAKEREPGLAEHVAVRLELASADSFHFGLDCLIEGIAARVRGR